MLNFNMPHLKNSKHKTGCDHMWGSDSSPRPSLSCTLVFSLHRFQCLTCSQCEPAGRGRSGFWGRLESVAPDVQPFADDGGSDRKRCDECKQKAVRVARQDLSGWSEQVKWNLSGVDSKQWPVFVGSVWMSLTCLSGSASPRRLTERTKLVFAGFIELCI